MKFERNLKLDTALMFVGIMADKFSTYLPLVRKTYKISTSEIIERSLWLQTQPTEYLEALTINMLETTLSAKSPDNIRASLAAFEAEEMAKEQAEAEAGFDAMVESLDDKAAKTAIQERLDGNPPANGLEG